MVDQPRSYSPVATSMATFLLVMALLQKLISVDALDEDEAAEVIDDALLRAEQALAAFPGEQDRKDVRELLATAMDLIRPARKTP
jgi:hypothetical protein